MSAVVRPEADFDYRNPNYLAVFNHRRARIERLRRDPEKFTLLLPYYKNNIAQFISDFGCTQEPRNAEIGLPTIIPFILFPKQTEWVDWVLTCWRDRKDGLTEKSRDMGMSWLSIAVSCSLCILYDGIAIGFGSRKEELVDHGADPKSLFYKARMFMQALPPEFRAGWDVTKHAPHMRLSFPMTGSVMAGESGDGIGRGDRKAIYFVDEAAHLERPQLVDNSLTATTNCRQDISSVAGSANPFYEKRNSGKVRVFTFHWRADPRRDDAWYKDLCARRDPVTIAQEYELNYAASVEGQVIPSQWVQAAVDLHKRLNIEPTGIRIGALDVADRGVDKNAFGVRYGILLEYAESWSGKGSDIFGTVLRAFDLCATHRLPCFRYDGDGLGAGVRGDARVVNEERIGHPSERRRGIDVIEYRGSGKVIDPESIVPLTDRTNEDFYENYKAQAWWALRFRFQASFRASQGLDYDPSEIISIASDFAESSRLQTELSQAVYKLSKAGKLLIDKIPDGALSPNLADCVVMLYAPSTAELIVTSETLDTVMNLI